MNKVFKIFQNMYHKSQLLKYHNSNRFSSNTTITLIIIIFITIYTIARSFSNMSITTITTPNKQLQLICNNLSLGRKLMTQSLFLLLLELSVLLLLDPNKVAPYSKLQLHQVALLVEVLDVFILLVQSSIITLESALVQMQVLEQYHQTTKLVLRRNHFY